MNAEAKTQTRAAMEPEAVDIAPRGGTHRPLEEQALVSIAISLKRIADEMEEFRRDRMRERGGFVD